MKKLLLCLLLPFSLQAQVTLYNNDFSGGSTGWSLGQGNNFDTWAVNSTYNCSDPTPNQGGGNYLHVTDDLNGEYCAAAVFLGLGSGGTCYATMSTGINTQGSNTDTIRFDWLCVGQSGPVLASYGTLDYSIDGGNSWINITVPQAQYNAQSTWITTTITSAQLPALLNQADFRLRFGFVNSGYGTNPAFAIDNLKITADITTGLSAAMTQQKTQTFPNPVTDQISLSGPGIQENAVIKIFNSIGQIISSDEWSIVQQEQGKLQLNLKKIPSGYYFVEVESPSLVIREKILKN
jgi:hypothetical protein